MPAALTIASGCDRTFYRSLVQLLYSLRRHDLDGRCRVVVYDLGLTEAQCRWIERRFGRAVDLRAFPFEAYPPHVRRLGTYAWKPAIVAELAAERGGPLLWLDSATLVLAPIGRVEDEIAARGLYTPYGGAGPIGDRLHPATAAYLGASPDELALRARAAALCGFDSRRPAVAALLGEWRRLALIEQCIAPPGATTANHRFDQVLFTVLLDRARRQHGFDLTEDTIDVSAPHPLPELSARNKVAAWVPEWSDPLVWRHFVARRWADCLRLRAFG